MSKYDKIISLGYNCELSFLIENYWGGTESFPFSWSYIHDKHKLLRCLKDMSIILDGETEFNIQSGMLLCKSSMISFHTKKNIAELLDSVGNVNEEVLEEATIELKARVEHLIEKWRNLFNNNNKVLFLIKVRKNIQGECLADYIRELSETLTIICGSIEYDCVAVLERVNEKELLNVHEIGKVKIRYVDKFVHDSKTNIDSDWDGWFRIFFEFDQRSKELYYERISQRIEQDKASKNG